MATKRCPFCSSEIDYAASRCPHCTSRIPWFPNFWLFKLLFVLWIIGLIIS